jgi:2-hydroxymuconate-semialdehyde hydrolase
MPESVKSRVVHVGPLETHYLEAGNGPHLVLLHGGEYGASAEVTWGSSIPVLAQRFHVLAPDMLGFGQTAKVYSFSDPSGLRITHLRHLLELLGVDAAYFAGNSAGGGTLLRAAVMDPLPLPMVKMVTICGNAGIFKSTSQADIETYDPSLRNMRKLLELLFHDEKWLTPELVEKRYENSIMPGAWEALSAARLRRPGYEKGSTTDAFVKSLRRVELPRLIMACDHDPLNQNDWDEKLREMVPGSKAYRFHHSAHEPQMEEPETFNRILTDFLLS